MSAYIDLGGQINPKPNDTLFYFHGLKKTKLLTAGRSMILLVTGSHATYL